MELTTVNEALKVLKMIQMVHSLLCVFFYNNKSKRR